MTVLHVFLADVKIEEFKEKNTDGEKQEVPILKNIQSTFYANHKEIRQTKYLLTLAANFEKGIEP
jgi:protein-disulfide isomerase-like protein with CxxC motif